MKRSPPADRTISCATESFDINFDDLMGNDIDHHSSAVGYVVGFEFVLRRGVIFYTLFLAGFVSPCFLATDIIFLLFS